MSDMEWVTYKNATGAKTAHVWWHDESLCGRAKNPERVIPGYPALDTNVCSQCNGIVSDDFRFGAAFKRQHRRADAMCPATIAGKAGRKVPAGSPSTTSEAGTASPARA